MKDKILQLIKKHPEGLTIQNIVNELNVSWATITKTLALLEGMELIKIREVGRAKLHYLK